MRRMCVRRPCNEIKQLAISSEKTPRDTPRECGVVFSQPGKALVHADSDDDAHLLNDGAQRSDMIVRIIPI